MIWKLPINLKDDSILTLDLQPYSRRLVLAGVQGTVKVYDMKKLMERVLEERGKPGLGIVDDVDEERETFLIYSCQKREGSVNTVRWSQAGRHFLSGGDDKQIVLWKRIKTDN